MWSKLIRRTGFWVKQFKMAESLPSSTPSHKTISDDQARADFEDGVPATSVKRAADADRSASPQNVHNEAKKQKTEETRLQLGDPGYVPYKKKKVALMFVYSGKGYLGMQIQNAGFKTIEGELMPALVKAGVIRPDWVEQPGRLMHFQRAARTDKGVSAAGQLVSFKMFVDVDDPVEKINSHLPPEIRVLDIKRTTRGFDCKQACSARTYMYMLPTFVFTPCEEFTKEDFRINDDILKKVNLWLGKLKGTHNFHNFTSGKKPTDPSARRYIMDFSIGEPFERDGLEWAVIKVKGQSFMLHQIRKMIGLTIAIVKGLAKEDSWALSFSHDKVDVPKAPGVGLVLDRLHYDQYNKKFGHDHEKLDWTDLEAEIEKFKEKYIYSTIVETEKEEKSMLKWLSTLHLHHFGVINIQDEYIDRKPRTGIAAAQRKLDQLDKQASSPQPMETDSNKSSPQPVTDSVDSPDQSKVTADGTTSGADGTSGTNSEASTENKVVNADDTQNTVGSAAGTVGSTTGTVGSTTGTTCTDGASSTSCTRTVVAGSEIAAEPTDTINDSAILSAEDLGSKNDVEKKVDIVDNAAEVTAVKAAEKS